MIFWSEIFAFLATLSNIHWVPTQGQLSSLPRVQLIRKLIYPPSLKVVYMRERLIQVNRLDIDTTTTMLKVHALHVTDATASSLESILTWSLDYLLWLYSLSINESNISNRFRSLNIWILSKRKNTGRYIVRSTLTLPLFTSTTLVLVDANCQYSQWRSTTGRTLHALPWHSLSSLAHPMC